MTQQRFLELHLLQCRLWVMAQWWMIDPFSTIALFDAECAASHVFCLRN